MTDGVAVAVLEQIRRRVFTLNGAVALVGTGALVIGLFTGSAAGRIICGLIVAAAAAYLYVSLRRGRRKPEAEDRKPDGLPSPEAEMKTLLFDDFQSTGSGYIVKDIDDDQNVVPSSKSTHPVSAALRPETVRELEILDG